MTLSIQYIYCPFCLVGNIFWQLLVVRWFQGVFLVSSPNSVISSLRPSESGGRVTVQTSWRRQPSRTEHGPFYGLKERWLPRRWVVSWGKLSILEKILLIYLLMTVLGLCCCSRLSLVAVSGGYSLVAACEHLIVGCLLMLGSMGSSTHGLQ